MVILSALTFSFIPWWTVFWRHSNMFVLLTWSIGGMDYEQSRVCLHLYILYISVLIVSFKVVGYIWRTRWGTRCVIVVCVCVCVCVWCGSVQLGSNVWVCVYFLSVQSSWSSSLLLQPPPSVQVSFNHLCHCTPLLFLFLSLIHPPVPSHSR